MTDNDIPESASSSRRRTIVFVLIASLAVAVAPAIWILSRSAAPPAGNASRVPGADQPRQDAPRAAQPAPEPAAPAAAGPTSRRAKPRPEPAAEPAAPPPAPTTGTLTVECDVPGAMVFLDREFKGAAPVVIDGVTPGSHRLNLSAEGYDGYSEAVDIAAGPNSLAVRFKEVKLNEVLDVVHKHTAGSCSGKLFADPQGLRYETANKSDAFVLPFADVEAFEVDYLKKNLRIKQRGGRTYNFTGDSADALFVFHRNVQKARERLAKGEPPAPSRPR